MNTRSISTKIDIALVVLFLTMLVVSALYQFSSQRAMVEEMVVKQANGLAESYFDNVNTLMLTGKMAQKELARNKIVSRDEVIDAKVLRGEEVSRLYGPAKGSSAPSDQLDQQALRGETLETFYSDEDGRRLTIAFPLVASADFRGTNCLACHAAKEGTVIGSGTPGFLPERAGCPRFSTDLDQYRPQYPDAGDRFGGDQLDAAQSRYQAARGRHQHLACRGRERQPQPPYRHQQQR